jgi:hypothetical protein
MSYHWHEQKNDSLVTQIVNLALSIRIKGERQTKIHSVLNLVNVSTIDKLFTMKRGDLIEVEKALLDLKKAN